MEDPKSSGGLKGDCEILSDINITFDASLITFSNNSQNVLSKPSPKASALINYGLKLQNWEPKLNLFYYTLVASGTHYSNKKLIVTGHFVPVLSYHLANETP